MKSVAHASKDLNRSQQEPLLCGPDKQMKMTMLTQNRSTPQTPAGGQTKPRRLPPMAATWACVAALGLWGSFSPALAEDEFEMAPLNYSQTKPRDAAADLELRLKQNPNLLAAKTDKEFVIALLRELNVPVESQMLVFSKTSLQRGRISPDTPRAIYFNEQSYVGWVPGGEAEIMSFDPQLGATFYLVPKAHFHDRPVLVRDGECLSCHAGSRTRGVPAPLVRSVFTDRQGEAILSAGSFSISHQNPLSERWGGWYVTGRHGSERHMGNMTAVEKAGNAILDREAGANLLNLDRFFQTSDYPRPGSDIVALMVFEHQVGLQQRLLQANQSARIAIHRYESLMRELKEPMGDTLAGSALSVVRHQAEKLLEEMLFVTEAPLTGGGVEGDSTFTTVFQKSARRDSQGRSLRDLDLKTRLFRFRMSYLIYSPHFDGLPTPLRDRFWERLWALLNEERSPEPFDLLRTGEKQDIKEILLATKPGLPSYWKR